jgi:hypothetical protein
MPFFSGHPIPFSSYSSQWLGLVAMIEVSERAVGRCLKKHIKIPLDTSGMCDAVAVRE